MKLVGFNHFEIKIINNYHFLDLIDWFKNYMFTAALCLEACIFYYTFSMHTHNMYIHKTYTPLQKYWNDKSGMAKVNSFVLL